MYPSSFIWVCELTFVLIKRQLVFLSDFSESIQVFVVLFLIHTTDRKDVIHDSLKTCNTVRNSKWNAFVLVKSSASFKGRKGYASSSVKRLIRFTNREGTGILANASPQMVKGAFGLPKEAVSCKVLHNRSSIKLRELPMSLRAVMLVPLIVASTMAFLNSVAVDKVEELINDVTETEAVRLEALLYTSAKLPTFPQLLHVVFLAGQLIRGCRPFPQK
ncbi:hypothetical protein Tsp_00537 [Trichinella spiralis]|uniref:hypothetical protein n=1 Tax=Trichinella spiralis TaxID=6334 RepID=UPI0001EFBC6E|nr:hypothetical protein Tsp_00537 [Trichinella spiralis]